MTIKQNFADFVGNLRRLDVSCFPAWRHIPSLDSVQPCCHAYTPTSTGTSLSLMRLTPAAHSWIYGASRCECSSPAFGWPWLYADSAFALPFSRLREEAVLVLCRLSFSFSFKG